MAMRKGRFDFGAASTTVSTEALSAMSMSGCAENITKRLNAIGDMTPPQREAYDGKKKTNLCCQKRPPYFGR